MIWDEEYPHKIYASVLLDEEGKIINWKTGNYYWKEPCEAKMKVKHFEKLDKLSVKHTEFIVNNNKEHNEAFTIQAYKWFKQFELAADHVGVSPFIEDDFFKCDGIEVIRRLN